MSPLPFFTPMETFSLLRESLDQVIGLGALEEASDAVRSVGRADWSAMGNWILHLCAT